MKHIKEYFFCLLIFCSTAYAETTTPSSWQFDVAPYLWAINMNGRIQVGNYTLHNDQSFSDLLQQLNWGGMLWLGAHYKDNLGFFIDSVYASLSSSDGLGPVSITSRNHFGIFTGGISYKVYKKEFGNACNPSHVELEPYIGARYTLNDTTLKLLSLESVNNQQWTDPIIGLHFNYDITKRWALILMGDVGGTNATSDASYNLVGLIGFKPISFGTLFLGYRDLYQHYVTGSDSNRYNWQMRIFGPVIGFNFRF